MENKHGKWRYTSPTHVVLAFQQALDELDQEGGIDQRYQRYCENHETLVTGMQALGFEPLITERYRSPIITSFLYPNSDFQFRPFYDALKTRGFVIYPGKLTEASCFRIGTVGRLSVDDVQELVGAIGEVLGEMGCAVPVR